MDKGEILQFPSDRIRKTSQSQEAESDRADGAGERLYTLRVDLVEGPLTPEYAGKKIWRTIRIRGRQTLDTLHEAIFGAFDRFEEHLYEFSFGKKVFDRKARRYTPYRYYESSGKEELGAEDSAGTTIDSLGLVENMAFLYWFDFGDDWVHRIKVVSIEDMPSEGEFPMIVETHGESPPQYPDHKAYEEEDEGEEEHHVEEVADMADAMMEYLQGQWRDELEGKTLTQNTTLQAALNKLPAHWVEAICEQLDLPVLRRARERVKAIVEHLPKEGSLQDIWNQLPEPPRRMLSFLVIKHDGKATSSSFAQEFGVDTDTTWYWNEGQLPTTALGLLRLHGLAFVGRVKRGTQKWKSVVVPVELRDGLRKLAEAPDAFTNALPMPPPPPEREGPPISRDDIEKMLHGAVYGKSPDGHQLQEPPAFNLDIFLATSPFSRATESLYQNAAHEISLHPGNFSDNTIRELLSRMINGGRVDTRLMAYRLGAAIYGKECAKPALNDDSKAIRKWANELFDPQQ